MKISLFTGGFAQTNSYLVETRNGNFLIDAPQGVAEWATNRGVRIDDLLLTHQHYDHVEDAAALMAIGVRIHALEEYSPELTLEPMMRSIGMPVEIVPYTIDSRFEMGAPLWIVGLEIALAHIPGHALDSVTFHLVDHGIVFSGDTLFAGSIGRTDLPGGSTTQLLDGIAAHLMTLPPDTKVFPGHGPTTTIGEEARSNPYLE